MIVIFHEDSTLGRLWGRVERVLFVCVGSAALATLDSAHRTTANYVELKEGSLSSRNGDSSKTHLRFFSKFFWSS